MKAMKLSVIIPVYNAAQYLDRCMESLVVASEESSCEILLVDDGSTDGSLGICERWARNYPNVVSVIHQENMGVSSARNKGIEAAEGEYLAFVDADDYVCDGFIADMMGAMENETDFVLFDYERKEGESAAVIVPGIKPGTITAARMLVLTCESNSPCARLYKRAVADGARFPSGQSLGEDLIFNLKFLERAKTSCYVAKTVYTYEHNPRSRTATSAALADATDYAKMRRALLCFCESCGLGEDGENLAGKSMLRIIANYAARLYRAGFSKVEINAAMVEAGASELLDSFRPCGLKDYMRYFILRQEAYGLASLLLRGSL